MALIYRSLRFTSIVVPSFSLLDLWRIDIVCSINVVEARERPKRTCRNEKK